VNEQSVSSPRSLLNKSNISFILLISLPLAALHLAIADDVTTATTASTNTSVNPTAIAELLERQQSTQIALAVSFKKEQKKESFALFLSAAHAEYRDGSHTSRLSSHLTALGSELLAIEADANEGAKEGKLLAISFSLLLLNTGMIVLIELLSSHSHTLH
jgi:hypothetical protein